MTIQRQYSLPNCKLVLEGMGDESASSASSARPPLLTLISAECHFVGHSTPLVGGRDFLESLIAAVNNYTQELLSSVPHPTAHARTPQAIELKRVSPDVHRLTLHPKTDRAARSVEADEPLHLDLKTLQLFDLVEAIDQLCADQQTLPDLSLTLTPVPKRYVAAQEPVAQRVLPAALGVSGLTVAAIALFFVPVPEVRIPEPERTVEESPLVPSEEASPSPLVESPPSDEAVPEEDAPTSEESPEPQAENVPDTADAAIASASVAEENLEALLTEAPPISDPDLLDEMTGDLRRTISDAWDREHTFEEDLIYRIGVAENGDILGFKQVNEAAIDYTDETPLLGLLYRPVEGTLPAEEPIAQFRVVFTPDGVVQVSPWYGRPVEESTDSDAE